MRIVKTTGWMRSHFTANELSGWPDGIRYGDVHNTIDEQARQRRAARVRQQAERRRRKLLSGAIKPPKPSKVGGGTSLKIKDQ